MLPNLFTCKSLHEIFNPGIFNPRIFKLGIFNPAIFKHGIFYHGIFKHAKICSSNFLTCNIFILGIFTPATTKILQFHCENSSIFPSCRAKSLAIFQHPIFTQAHKNLAIFMLPPQVCENAATANISLMRANF